MKNVKYLAHGLAIAFLLMSFSGHTSQVHFIIDEPGTYIGTVVNHKAKAPRAVLREAVQPAPAPVALAATVVETPQQAITTTLTSPVGITSDACVEGDCGSVPETPTTYLPEPGVLFLLAIAGVMTLLLRRRQFT